MPCDVPHVPHLTHILNVQLMAKARCKLGLYLCNWAWMDPIAKARRIM